VAGLLTLPARSTKRRICWTRISGPGSIVRCLRIRLQYVVASHFLLFLLTARTSSFTFARRIAMYNHDNLPSITIHMNSSHSSRPLAAEYSAECLFRRPPFAMGIVEKHAIAPVFPSEHGALSSGYPRSTSPSHLFFTFGPTFIDD
jgi:hypothetical protein